MARKSFGFHDGVPAHEQIWDDTPAWPKWIAVGMMVLGFIPLLNLINFALFVPMLLVIAFTFMRSTHSSKNSFLASLFLLLAELITVVSIIWSLFNL